MARRAVSVDHSDLSRGRGAVIRQSLIEESREAHDQWPVPGYYDARARLLEAGGAAEFSDSDARRYGVPLPIPFLVRREFLLTEDDRVVEVTRGPEGDTDQR